MGVDGREHRISGHAEQMRYGTPPFSLPAPNHVAELRLPQDQSRQRNVEQDANYQFGFPGKHEFLRACVPLEQHRKP